MYQKQAGRDVSQDMDHYRSLVDIDFTADPRQLARQPFVPGQKDPPFRVIRHRRKPHWVWAGNEPNEMVWLYLHGQYTSLTTRSAR